MFEPPDGADTRMAASFWGSVQLGYTFGHRVFHGPEAEVGWWQFKVTNVEDTQPLQRSTNAHFGVGYRFGVDVWSWNTTALFIALRTSAGMIKQDAPLSPTWYLQAEVAWGVRFAMGPVRLRVTIGPAAGLYDIWGLVQAQAGVAVEL